MKKVGPRIPGGSADSRRLAAAILEVLAGVRTPLQAAESVGISLPRYYALESRALEGLVRACEPRPKGRSVRPEKEVTLLRRDMDRLRRDCDRQRALVRASQRAIGLAEPKPVVRKRKRRPTVRALRAVAVLRSAAPAAAVEAVAPAATS